MPELRAPGPMTTREEKRGLQLAPGDGSTAHQGYGASARAQGFASLQPTDGYAHVAGGTIEGRQTFAGDRQTRATGEECAEKEEVTQTTATGRTGSILGQETQEEKRETTEARGETQTAKRETAQTCGATTERARSTSTSTYTSESEEQARARPLSEPCHRAAGAESQ